MLRTLVYLPLAATFLFDNALGGEALQGPYALQVAANAAKLRSEAPGIRAGAAEALGFLRACSSEPTLIEKLGDPSAEVRSQVAMALAWCGGRKAIPPLMNALNDEDWVTRQAAHVALTNLTGMEFAFDAFAPPDRRTERVKAWRDWWADIPADRPPEEILDLLVGPRNLATGCPVTASTTYRGPADILTDGEFGPAYWQTKNVEPPQWCTIDLGRPVKIERVVIHQYGPGFCMTGYEVALSLDNRRFQVVRRERKTTPVELIVEFPAQSARYVRITSLGAERPLYPTTFYEIEVFGPSQPYPADRPSVSIDSVPWRQERGLRALGVLGGKGATEAVLEVLGDSPPTAPRQRPVVRAGIRALGRLREEAGFQALVRLLDNPMWARCAAEALGDVGDRRAVSPLLAAYARYAKRLDGKDPPDVPADDRMSFPSEDRMLETPYAIALALCRLPLDGPEDREALRRIAPLVIANHPGDFDTFMLYQPEVGHLLTRHLLEHSGLRQQACEHLFEQIGQARRVLKPSTTANAPFVVPPLGGSPSRDRLKAELRTGESNEAIVWPVFPTYRMASWLPAVCTEKEDLPRLVALLDHENGWVRINAAKALAWLGDRRAIEPIARRLAQAKAEADYGYTGQFKDEEYNDPSPRWREGLVRALGILGAHEHTAMLVRIMNDERSVLEIRHAAAEALVDLGNPEALGALREAALHHAFHSVRHIARDALWVRGEKVTQAVAGQRLGEVGAPRRATVGHVSKVPSAVSTLETCSTSWRPSVEESAGSGDPRRALHFGAIVFIKGDNDVPNTKFTVEQADRWRQTYVVTDEGPTYRPGDNLYVLRPPRPDGKVTPLTRFSEGYVADPEVSWNATQVVFCHRAKNDPWWHVYSIKIDGTGLRQLTHGPYHDVGPAWLPDGRIVFSTSRSGIRDEYHCYPCTALWRMNADGSDMHPISTNIGRDNEPAILPDGRIVFSRLEVFYSRNKTELTLHAMHPDGTQDMVLYGPERRAFWRNLDHGEPDPADTQEAPLTHRVLRMTQPQPMPDGRHIVVSTQAGLALIGSRRDTEALITPDYQKRAYTTPFPLPDGRILCASTWKTPDRKKVDLGLYLFDPVTKRLELVYNDPATADYEPRPVTARPVPPVRSEGTVPHGYSGRFVCASVFATQEKEVAERGRLVRVIEGVPVVGRHNTHTSPWPVWQNHGGTLARVLGTAPLAADGSFSVEVPADRLLHLQVLDSDRRVVGNQLTWIYPRPGETKSCVGCHEPPHSTPVRSDPLASHQPPLRFLPRGDEFRYRAKAWFKGSLPAEIEERTRTVHAVNLLGR